MATPDAARKLVELHNQLANLSLDDIKEMGHVAWQLEGIVRREPKNVLAVTTLAIALALLGRRDEAVERAQTAFDLRFQVGSLQGVLIGACSDLGLVEEARIVAGEVLATPHGRNDVTAMNNAAIAAVLAGDRDFLEGMAAVGPANVQEFCTDVLSCIDYHSLTDIFGEHMRLIADVVSSHCCNVEVFTDNVGEEPSFAIRYMLACDFRQTLALRRSLDDSLRQFYARMGRPDLPYVNAIVHILSPLPAMRARAA